MTAVPTCCAAAATCAVLWLCATGCGEEAPTGVELSVRYAQPPAWLELRGRDTHGTAYGPTALGAQGAQLAPEGARVTLLVPSRLGGSRLRLEVTGHSAGDEIRQRSSGEVVLVRGTLVAFEMWLDSVDAGPRTAMADAGVEDRAPPQGDDAPPTSPAADGGQADAEPDSGLVDWRPTTGDVPPPPDASGIEGGRDADSETMEAEDPVDAAVAADGAGADPPAETRDAGPQPMQDPAPPTALDAGAPARDAGTAEGAPPVDAAIMDAADDEVGECVIDCFPGVDRSCAALISRCSGRGRANGNGNGNGR